MKTPLHVGLASYGMSGEVFHAPLLSSHPGFTLSKIVERKTQRAGIKYPAIQSVRTYNELLADPEIDLIVVNTPNSLHFEQAKQALEAGKHVIVEKPFTVNSQEGQILIELARQKNLVLSVFQNRRWDGDFLTVQEVVKSGILGTLVEFEAHYDRFRNYVEADTWKEESGPGSGILYNLGSHMIDQALVLFGLPQSVTADIRIQRPGGKIDDSYDLRLNYKDIRVIVKSGYLVREPGPRYTLLGTDGTFHKYGLDPQEDALKIGRFPNEKGWGVEDSAFWGKINTQVGSLHVTGTVETQPGSYLAFYENIFQAITAGASLAVQPEQAMQVIQIIEAAIESNRLGKTVPIK
ncbi:oxidoreductase [Rhodocytophaga rosea]|uniref:Oxidoreductase n=1 Tax=Rhodocytophaga rosea TaxID=2704465 RepID=A0A6C0GF03_9BACT|nr:oxidoreductase [Rhodocytophaga rosea]QHT66581.1 oxidoreductase [Rhodocytophaga rosea]